MNMKIREILAALAVSALCGCTDYLDVVPDNIATIEMAFNNWPLVTHAYHCMAINMKTRD